MEMQDSTPWVPVTFDTCAIKAVFVSPGKVKSKHSSKERNTYAEKKCSKQLGIHETLRNTVCVFPVLISKGLVMLLLTEIKIYQLCKYHWKTNQVQSISSYASDINSDLQLFTNKLKLCRDFIKNFSRYWKVVKWQVSAAETENEL